MSPYGVYETTATICLQRGQLPFLRLIVFGAAYHFVYDMGLN